ncbi:hypothetical protein MVEN_01097400 [Mycena venus]|uniref:Uncharacterized protein n=1 Tax=Mycena venus TaxID=2733690 RepID=A0A8H7CXN0_9AGAR|nr:hypothetical protein MVEN_01097400 [Mycena venus]
MSRLRLSRLLCARFRMRFALSTLARRSVHADWVSRPVERTRLTHLFSSWFRLDPPPPPIPNPRDTMEVIALARYHLTIPTSTSTPLQLVFKSLLRHSISFGSASGAGYGLSYSVLGPNLHERDPVKKVIVQKVAEGTDTRSLELPIADANGSLDSRQWAVSMTYTGAVIEMHESKVVVSHYL